MITSKAGMSTLVKALLISAISIVVALGIVGVVLSIINKEFQIVFLTDDSTPYEVKVAKRGTLVEEPLEPQKTGYAFDGWLKGENETDFWKFDSDIVSKNIVLYADFDAILFDIEYILNGGINDSESAIHYTIEDQEIILKTPSKKGYLFNGWYLNEDFSGESIQIITGEHQEKVTLYAKWDLADYNIKYNLNGGTNDLANPLIYNITDEVIVLKEPKREGSAFGGWFYNSALRGKPVTEIDPNFVTDVVLFAKWERLFNVSYELDGGTNDPLNPVSYSGLLNNIVLMNPVRPGYSFAGWYDNQGFSGIIVEYINTLSGKDLTFYAKWDVSYYGITYYLNGGTENNNPLTYSVLTEYVSLGPAYREAYDFVGWYDNRNLTGDPVTRVETSLLSEVFLWAKWTPTIFKITYYVGRNGMNNSENPTNYTLFSEDMSLFDPERQHFIFIGWYKSADYSGERVLKILASEIKNIELWAKWDPILFPIYYHLGIGEENSPLNPETYHVDLNDILLNSASKHGHNFLGWYDSEVAGNRVEVIDTSLALRVDLWPRFELATYTVSYHLTSDVDNSLNNILSYQIIDLDFNIYDPIRQHYIFKGWYFNSDFSGEIVTTIITYSAQNLDLYPKWEAVKFEITYNLEAGADNPDNPTYYTYDNDTIVLRPAIKKGYNFVGWEDSEGNQVSFIDTKMAVPVELWGSFELAIYQIKYILNGGVNNVINPHTYNILMVTDSPVLLLYDATRTGYNFLGWYDNPAFGGSRLGAIATNWAKDITLHAKFEAIQYNVYYNLEDDAVNDPRNKAFNTVEGPSSITLYEPTRSGYEFLGWYSSPYDDLVITSYPFDLNNLKENTFYPKWQIITYTVEYVLNGGILDVPIEEAEYQVIDSNFTLRIPFRAHYDFLGWYLNSADSGLLIEEVITANVVNLVVCAKWQLHDYLIDYSLSDGESNNSANPLTYTIADGEIVFGIPTKRGYDFWGWFIDESRETPITSIITSETGRDLKIYPKFVIHIYQIRYQIDPSKGENFSSTPTTEYTVESEVILLVPAKDGYAFGYWYDLATGDVVSKIAVGTIGDRYFVPVWYKLYYVTYQDEYGNEYSAESNPNNPHVFHAGMANVLLVTPIDLDSMYGYTFAGWRQYIDDTRYRWVRSLDTSTESDLTLVVAWFVTVTYIVPNLEGYNRHVEMVYRDGILMEPHPFIFDATIVSWHTDPSLSDESIFDGFWLPPVGSQITLYGKKE